MSVSSIAQDSALRLATPKPVPADPAVIAESAARAALDASSRGMTEAEAIEQGAQAATDPGGTPAPPSVSPGPLAQLVKYVPTETITVYVAVTAALGDDAGSLSRWLWAGLVLVLTIALAVGLGYRAQKDADPAAPFTLPVFEPLAAGVGFVVWALSLPSTPLRTIEGFDYSAWNPVILLLGTVTIAATAHVLGKNVTWNKVLET